MTKTNTTIDIKINEKKSALKGEKRKVVKKSLQKDDVHNIKEDEQSQRDKNRIANRNSVRKFRYREKIMIEELQRSVSKLTRENRGKSDENDCLKRAILEVGQILSLATNNASVTTGASGTIATSHSTPKSENTATAIGLSDSVINNTDHYIFRPSSPVQVEIVSTSSLSSPSPSPRSSPSSSPPPPPVNQAQQQFNGQQFGSVQVSLPGQAPVPLSSASLMRLQQQLLSRQASQSIYHHHYYRPHLLPVTPPMQVNDKLPILQHQQQKVAKDLNYGSFDHRFMDQHYHNQQQQVPQQQQLPEIPYDLASSLMFQQQQHANKPTVDASRNKKAATLHLIQQQQQLLQESCLVSGLQQKQKQKQKPQHLQGGFSNKLPGNIKDLLALV